MGTSRRVAKGEARLPWHSVQEIKHSYGGGGGVSSALVTGTMQMWPSC